MSVLQPIISKTLNGTIWRLEIDEISDCLVAEVRNEAEKQVSFTSINLRTGKLNFTGYETQERWLTGTEAAYNGVILLHQYKHESGPEHKGIMAVDAVTASELWSNYSIAFDHLTINGPVVYNTAFQTKKLVLIDGQTGETIRAYDTALDKPLQNSIVIPHITTDGPVLPDSFTSAAYGNIVHYLNHNNLRVVSLHTQKNGVLQQEIFVSSGTETVYHDLLNTGIQKMQPESFVLHKNALVYIKNKRKIKVLNLKITD